MSVKWTIRVIVNQYNVYFWVRVKKRVFSCNFVQYYVLTGLWLIWPIDPYFHVVITAWSRNETKLHTIYKGKEGLEKQSGYFWFLHGLCYIKRNFYLFYHNLSKFFKSVYCDPGILVLFCFFTSPKPRAGKAIININFFNLKEGLTNKIQRKNYMHVEKISHTLNTTGRVENWNY